MLSNCVAGEDSEYSLEGVMLKLQYFGNLMQKASSLEKTLMLGRTGGRRRGGWQRMRWLDGITYDNGHELGQTLGDGEGQRGLVCCSPWGRKELDVSGWLNNFSLVRRFISISFTQTKNDDLETAHSYVKEIILLLYQFSKRWKWSECKIWELARLKILKHGVTKVNIGIGQIQFWIQAQSFSSSTI